ncbi:type I glyceraldehyde-3-phosphate dehydrogenase [Staphylococcus epidermidis]|uniref:type I glyceraldehyde-3-phosphate dehydrogenase n=1 Tax=Staphylococcus epidermidis TaxID=1282 RepID=UPI0001AB1C77|nr:type I glyceraldehyde-3-phosphate dehydrogenase [Staphylococcus epidermidis]EES57910.1 glyceraldehyde-3-phosphate dehydrogenase, type I [Staphylococcus epidermidis BCM-HMP0060]MCG1795554.1 type I glyceraldehyde-3-phosphate dehydrogenase [Staphylococcus epidermidis]MCG2488045.1 type I glyceraldehyde-3-phosphate dehydrogenase [Staphylococcus epidermidis]MCG2540002.1 type I glyceraldehyde-3-phosphate dehydrogenase [Staphylococcus epidermidis]MCO6333693.1 type I glyceraldehyde-3-phosphate dehyd
MVKKIAINGFGRIGRLAFRSMLDMENVEVVAINDLTNTEMLAHLLEFDSSQGRLEKSISFDDNTIYVDDKKVNIFSEKDPHNLPWKSLEIDLVLECTGLFASKEKSQSHIDAGAKKVVISAPAGNDLPTIVFGINENTLTSDDKIISAASCTTNCLAPIAKVLNDLSEVKSGFMTTLHAYTNDQSTQDSPHPKGDLRRARAAALNIAPTSTGAAKAIGLVIPELKGKLDGVSQRVPVSAGSLTELTAVCNGNIDVNTINEKVHQMSSDSFGYTNKPIVSSDIIGMKYGSLYDETLTKVFQMENETLVKISAWYDNESSYVAQMIRTIEYFLKL